jgi:hypothetical protein
VQVATGKVIDGKVVLEGVCLREGDTVAVVAHGADETFSLSENQREELLASIQDIEAGKGLTLDEVLSSLPTAA